MLDLLSDFLDTETTVEEKHLLREADEVLQRADLDYEHIIEEILMTDQEMDRGAALTEIIKTYHQGLDHLLNLHAVVLVDDTKLQQKITVMNGLLDVDNTENPEQFFKIADEEAPPVEKLAVILAQVTTVNADELMQVIVDVSDTFFTRLKEVNRAEIHIDEEELQERRARIHAYRLFDVYLVSVGATITYIPTLLTRGVNPALEYDLYTHLIDGMQPIMSLPPKQIARELFAAALLSCDAYGSPGDAVKNSLEQFIPELKVISEVMIEVRNLTMGYAK